MKRRPEMSLRLRLIGLIAVVLGVSLVFGVLIECFNASRSVRTEMHAAVQVGRQAVEDARESLQTSGTPQRDLKNLITSFRGNRHLRVSLIGDDGVVTRAEPHVETSPFGAAAGWFVRLIGVPPETDRVPVVVNGHRYGTVVIRTDPHNEILEVWNEFNDSTLVLALFCAQVILLVYLLVGRALKPLDRLASAIEQVGQGVFGTRISIDPAPELARLCGSFNQMADQLAAADAEKRHLNKRLLTLQEEERGQLARDLHDEVSPFLFAVNVDLATVSRLIRSGRSEQVVPHLASIAEAVGHMQREVRGLLGRLQPAGLADFGLADAVANMVSFWRRRHPGIHYQVDIATRDEALGDLIDTTLYRVIQECLSNAVRHGRPSRIDIAVHCDTGPQGEHQVVAMVTDDGAGMSQDSGPGFGLRGMVERVKATGGSLSYANRTGGGLVVTAVLPLMAAGERAPANTEMIRA